MAIIFDSIYLGRNSVSIQVKAHEVHILPFEERKSILQYKEMKMTMMKMLKKWKVKKKMITMKMMNY